MSGSIDVPGENGGSIGHLADGIRRAHGEGTTESDLAANQVLDWEVVGHTRDRGNGLYYLAGANDPRLCRHRAKFDPASSVYYQATSQSTSTCTVTELYSPLSQKIRYF